MEYSRQRLRRSSRSNESAISRILSAAGNAKLAQEKAKQEIIKQQILSKMRSQQANQDFKAREDYRQQLKANDPAEVFLRNRFQAEKPLDRTVLPTKKRPEAEFPADEVVQGRTGKLELKPLDEDRKSQLFLQKLEKAKADYAAGKGKAPSKLALKIGERMTERVNRKLGYKKDAEEDFSGVASYETKKRSAKQGPNPATQKALKKLSEMASEGTLTQAEAMEELNSNEEAYALAGVDIGYVRSRISSILPEEKRKGSKGFFGIGRKPEMKKKGGVWYKKVDNSWQLTDSPEE